MLRILIIALAGCRAEKGGEGEEDVIPETPADGDGDGFDTAEDCDDADGGSYPGAAEICDGLDNDCDGIADEEVTDTFYADSDGDGFGDGAAATEACEAPAGYVAVGSDCDDADDESYPSAAERCDEKDNDCDEQVDEDATTEWYADADGDGYGDAGAGVESCDPEEGYVADNSDCDDTDGDAFPGGSEVCDEADNNCNSAVDEGVTTTWYVDNDGDGYGSADLEAESCDPLTGYAASADDCDDGDAQSHPGAGETCDGEDDDCDGAVDEGVTDAFYADADGDGFGDAAAKADACEAPAGYVGDDADCDDGEAGINPGADETCDGEDDDCDGSIDEDSASDAPAWYGDSDGDGYGGDVFAEVSCEQPSAYVDNADDCDDLDPDAHPGAGEACDGEDDDCDGEADEGAESAFYADADGDGYGDAAEAAEGCEAPPGYVADGTDCDDQAAEANPGRVEVCDEADNDCDGSVDEGVTATYYADTDGDGFGGEAAAAACEEPAGFASQGGDCDDAEPGINPGGTEVCDGEDTDCDGLLPGDEEADEDGDGLRDCADAVAGTALSFDGDDIVTIPGSSALAGVMTVEAWFQTSAEIDDETALVGKHYCGYGNGWFLGLHSYWGQQEVAQWMVDHDPRIYDTVTLNDGTWHHMAGVYDGSSYVLYVDGAAVASGSVGYTATNALDIVLGLHGDVSTCGAHYYQGLLDEVSLWSVARSAPEIAADMAGPLTGAEPGLVGYWRFDERSGQAAADESASGWHAALGRSAAAESADPTWVDASPF